MNKKHNSLIMLMEYITTHKFISFEPMIIKLTHKKRYHIFFVIGMLNYNRIWASVVFGVVHEYSIWILT